MRYAKYQYFYYPLCVSKRTTLEPIQHKDRHGKYLYLKKRKQTYFNSLIKEVLLANLLNVLIFENDQKCLRKSFYIYAPDPIMQKGLVSPIMLSSRHYAAPK